MTRYRPDFARQNMIFGKFRVCDVTVGEVIAVGGGGGVRLNAQEDKLS